MVSPRDLVPAPVLPPEGAEDLVRPVPDDVVLELSLASLEGCEGALVIAEQQVVGTT